MLASTFLVFATGLFGLASAQSTTSAPASSPSSLATSTTSATSAYSYTVAAGSVPSATAAAWCQSQMNSCNAVCGNVAYPNSCDPSTLTYSCKCTLGSTPDLTQFNGTLPFYECLQYINNCVLATDNAQAQHQCRAIQCGGKNPQAALSASLAAASGSMPSNTGSMVTTTRSSSSSGTSTSKSASSSHNAAAAAVDVELWRFYGTGTLVASVFALVGFLL